MAYEEFRGELDKPTEFEEFDGVLDSGPKIDIIDNPFFDKTPVKPAAKSSASDFTLGDPMGGDLGAAIMDGRTPTKSGIVGRVADALKPAPKSVMDAPANNTEARLKAGAGPISQQTFEQAGQVRAGKAKSDSPVINRAAKGVRTFEEVVDQAKQAQALLEGDQSGFNPSLMPDQFKSGVAGMQQGYFSTVAKSNAALLNLMDRIDAGEKITPADDPLGYQDMSTEQRAQIRAQIESALPKNIANVIAYGQEQALYAKNPAAEDLIKKANAGDYKGAWTTFLSDPMGIIQQLSVQSAPNALPSLVGGAAGVLMKGGMGGFMMGLATGSFPVEYMASITESLRDSGVDMTDAKAVEAKLRDPKFLEDAGKRAVTRGTVIAAADAASGKLLMPLRANQLGRNIARGGANVGIEAGLEGGGEAAAQTFSGEEFKVGEIAAEFLGAGPQAVGTTAIKTASEALNPSDPKSVAARQLASALETAEFTPEGVDAAVRNRLRTEGVSDQINPAATTITSFTPPDSPSAQAGLVPITVPTEVPDVSATSVSGTTPGVGGVAGSDQPDGGVGVPGLGAGGTGLLRGGDAGLPAADAGTDVPAGDRGVQRTAGVGRLPQVAERATDQDLLGRVNSALGLPNNNNADVQPAEQWFGRRGDGYATEGDATQALPGRQRMFPELSWKIELMPNGKYRLGGYQLDQGATNGRTSETAAAGTGLDQRTRQQSGAATGTATVENLVNEGAPSLSNVELPRTGSTVDAGQVRVETQQRLDTLRQQGRITKDIRLGTPDADVERGVQELGAALNEQFGASAKIIPFADMAKDAVNGFELGGNVFVNAQNLDVSAPRTTLHEFKHVIERIAAAEKAMGMQGTAAQQFVADIDSIFDDMTDEGKRAYVEKFLHKDELDAIADPAEREAKVQEFMAAPLLRSEMTADFLGNRAQDRQFLADLAAADPQGFKGFVERWIKLIDNLIDKLKGSKDQSRKESAKVDEYIRDLAKAKMVARDALIAYRKGTLAQQATAAAQDQAGGPAFSNREKIGDFDVRTMKDGTAVVYGDPNAIRAQIPDDVKGRVTKDGIVFTTAAAPRVKAALTGRTTAYSREGAVLDKLPMKNGKYVGAPDKFDTPAKIPTLRKWLRQLAMEGQAGRYWYENSGREVLKMVGGDVQEARRFVALLAIYSPQAKVDANSTFALRAWAQYKAGQPIKVKTGVQDKKAREAMADVDAFWKGEKTGNFFFNLLREIDPSTAGKQGATIDMWMMRAGQYDNDAPTATQYAFMENETNRLAAELGWEPQQVQAAIWVAMKARMENAGVKKRTEASSEKKGWIHYEYPLKNGRPVKTRKIDNAKAHRDNWLKHAFAHDPTKDDTAQAKFDFGDGLKRHIGQVSFEARPGRTTGVLPGIHNAPYAQQVEFQQAVQAAFLDENGNDTLAQMLGLLVDTTDILAPGVWQGEISPSSQKLIAMAPAAGKDGKTQVDPAQAEALNIYAAISGLVARQEGVGWHRPFYAGTKRDANGLDINLGRVINPAEAADLSAAVGEWMKNNGHPEWEDQFAFISSPQGIRIVNFGIISNDQLQSDIVRVAESVLPDFEYRVFASAGDMPTNNWKEYPNGQSYVQRISAAGRSDVLEWARAVLAPRVQRVFDEYAEKYGWGDPGEIRFSERERGSEREEGRGAEAREVPAQQSREAARDAGQTARQGRLDPLPGAPRVQGFTGPDPRLVSVAEQYARDNGIPLRRQSEYVQVDPERAKRIAKAYEEMPHAPNDLRVKAAYKELIKQVTAQYRALEKAGYKFWFIDLNNPDNLDYLSTPWNAMRDIRANQQMGIFPTAAGFGNEESNPFKGNPMEAETGIRWPVGGPDSKRTAPVLANDLFRAVHDAFGHGLEGAGFREQGEENAWQAHRRLFTGSAVAAITSEPRGQNSWLNYGPYGEANRTAKVEDTVFADQKTGLMPEWTWTEGIAGDMPAFSNRQPNTNPFYSQLAKVIDQVPERLATQPAKQWSLWLDSNAAKAGVKRDEIEWTGIKDYLSLLGNTKVSKDQLSDFLRNNGVQIDEVMRGEDGSIDYGDMYVDLVRRGGTEWAVHSEDGEIIGGEYETREEAEDALAEMQNAKPTKYGQYTLPGGENYRELLLTLPERAHPMAIEVRALGITKPLDDVSGEDIRKAGGTDEQIDRWIDSFSDGQRFGKNFKSSHWDENNIVAHIRFNDRVDADGQRVLFIEELQSDWAQAGRKKGFELTAAQKAANLEEVRQLQLEINAIRDRGFEVPKNGTPENQVDPNFLKVRELIRRRDSLQQRSSDNTVPTAPFVTDTKAWVALAVKRMIAYAVENGYDKVAFVNGDQSADRYDLSKQVDSIAALKNPDGTWFLQAEKDGQFLSEKTSVKTSDLPEAVGKELADKIVAESGQEVFRDGAPFRMYSGLDLKVGGEGMKSFYDRIVPQVVADVLKKVGGGKVETVQIVRPNASRRDEIAAELEAEDGIPRRRTSRLEQFGFTITDAMREKVGTEGLPMFSARQTETPEFKRWSRDLPVYENAADGENNRGIYRLYHATTADFDEFIPGGLNPSDSGRAVWLSPYKEYQSAFFRTGGNGRDYREGANVMPVYARLERPLIIDDKNMLDWARSVFASGSREFPQLISDTARDSILEEYDSIIFDGESLGWGENSNEFIVFDGRQVKSAIGNNGAFDENEANIRFSLRQQPIQGSRFFLKGESRTAEKRRFLQDYFLRVKEVQDAIEAQGGTVGEAQDVYMAESLSYGRLQEQLTDFKEQTVKPLLRKVRAAGLELSDLALFAYAMHAKERNAAMSSINARLNSDEGSGMTDQEADDIINAYTRDGHLQDLQDLHSDLMAITSSTRQVLLSEGLIDQDEFDRLENQFDYYVPLRGFVEDELDVVSGQRVGGSRLTSGKGFNVRGKETVRALGRTSRAGHIIENIIADYERAIGRAERNNVAKIFLDLVTTNPDPRLWEIDATRTTASMNRQTGTVQYNSLIDKGEDTVSVKVNGREVYIKVNDPLLVRAMRLSAKDETGEVTRFLVGTIGWYGNLMRNTLTRFNPAFGAVNAFKDFGFSTISTLADLGPKGMALFWKNYANPIQSGPIYEEFRAAGATTGGWHMRSAKELQNELRRLMEWEGGSGIRAGAYRGAKGILNTLEFVGQYSETQARFAAYKAARDMGLSPARAASIAKEVSTNFNRKGEWGSAMNTAYVFFNAGVQGSAKTLKNLRSPWVMGAMTALTGMSAGLAFMAAAVGGDDEDGQAYWDKIPDEIKQRNVIIMLPPGDPLIGTGYARVGSRGRYIKLPIQYGLNVFSTLGYQIADVIRHGEDAKRGKSVGDAAINMTSVVFGAFNPIGGAFDPTKPVEVGLAAAPSIVDVAIQFLVGVDAFGKPTSPTKSPFDQKPDSENYTPAMAGSWEQRLATWLNSATGGDAAVSGRIDLAPGTIRNVVRNATGGAGDFLSSVFVNIPSKLMDPVADIQAKDIPVLKAFYGEADESTDLSEYYKRRADVMKAAEEAGRRAKLGIKFDYDEDNVGLQSLGKAAKVYTDLMSELRKRELEIATDGSLPKDKQTQMRKDIQRERVSVARDFNALFMQMKGDVESKKFLSKEVLEYEPSDWVQEKTEDYKIERRQKLEDNKARAAGG